MTTAAPGPSDTGPSDTGPGDNGPGDNGPIDTGPIITAPGNYQTALGAPADWDPADLGSALTDPDDDGIFSRTVFGLPAGSYRVKVTHGLSWNENYGAGGVPGGADIDFAVPAGWDAAARNDFRYDIGSHLLTVASRRVPNTAHLAERSGHWLRRDLIAWDLPVEAVTEGWTVRLHSAADGGLRVDGGGVIGGTVLSLDVDAAGLPADIVSRWPHLVGYAALELRPADADPAALRRVLTGQAVLAAYDNAGFIVAATGLQIPGVLDDLFDATDGDLGVVWDGPVPALAVWAPTARRVAVSVRAPSGAASTHPMVGDDDGVWSVVGDPDWSGAGYLYEVEVYRPEIDAVVTDLVTDPYSVALTTNSARSVIVDLESPALKPSGWDQLIIPPLAQPVDSAIYELHIRDFSIGDGTVPPADRGGYRAFTHLGSAGMLHLAALSAAGLNTLHLLPAFDFSTVDDVKSDWQNPDCDLAALSAADPAGTAQQECVAAVAARDGFNWGYDPWHYSVPDGSYAADPDGAVRTLDFREMVSAVTGIGLRVVLDVVYNHTVASGDDPRSVLDRIVPGYYHRLSATGQLEQSTCCPNTAAEHAMMEKLIVDSVLLWARQYRIGGFRFDLMGHHPRSTMLKVRAALDSLTVEDDGVDGRSLYVYGEGWNFGEVANNARFVQATQTEMAGTGIGTFNDRLRDAVRGGGPFDQDPRVQGFGTGLSTDPNGSSAAGPPMAQVDALLLEQDRIKVGLTGNLRDFPLVDRWGNRVTGSQIPYGGSGTGYCAEPADVVTYVDAHDNETLFDILAMKLPVALPMPDRVRMNTLCLAVVALGQGPMFWHAGTDLLRSKSLDRNSFNSGDWFNRVDWAGASSAFGSGLPPAAENQQRWELQRSLLANPTLVPGSGDIAASRAAALDLLRIRSSSRLFRLGSAARVIERVSFPHGGPAQPRGVIVMVLSDSVESSGGSSGGSSMSDAVDDAAGDLDPERERIVVVFNATPWWQSVALPDAGSLVLHAVQVAGVDPVVRLTSVSADAVTVPPRTVAVLQS